MSTSPTPNESFSPSPRGVGPQGDLVPRRLPRSPNIGVLGSHGVGVTAALAALCWPGVRRGVGERVERCMATAAELANRVEQEERLELFDQPQSGVVLWRPRGADLRSLHGRLEGAFVSLAALGEELWLRSVAANPNASAQLVVERVLAAA